MRRLRPAVPGMPPLCRPALRAKAVREEVIKSGDLENCGCLAQEHWPLAKALYPTKSGNK